MVSAHTAQVGKSDPRGSGRDASVERTSATAGIVTSLRSGLAPTYTGLFDDVATQMRWFYVIQRHYVFASQRSLGIPACTQPKAVPNGCVIIYGCGAPSGPGRVFDCIVART